ncbi:MAG: hypothetical protein WC427_03320 [Candidatus Paceibacterota bacterium]
MISERFFTLKWQFEKSSQQEILPRKAVDQANYFLSQWIKVFPKEKTWVQKKYKIPSLIVRFDCVFRDNLLLVYEIEERPAGIGIAFCLNNDFKKRLCSLKEKWPDFKSVVSFNRKESDDFLWIPVIKIEEAKKEDCLLLIRAEPEEKEFHFFQNRSISSLVNKGDKSYGEKMNFWKPVNCYDFENLPWKQSFCLKPKKGSKCRGIQIWSPELKNKRVGVSTKSQIKKALDYYQEMYLQEYVSPLIEPWHGRNLYKTHRIYFGYNPIIKKYECLEGIWLARPNLRIHGASDAVIGPLKIEEN